MVLSLAFSSIRAEHSAMFSLLLLATSCYAYDPGVALSMAYLEKAVYCGPVKFANWVAWPPLSS